MKTRYTLFLLLLILAISLDAAPRFKRKQWVYWQEVNITGQSFLQVGMIISKDLGEDTYRILSKDGWKMHLKPEALTLVPKTKKK
jgi:hypothetical protein